MCTACKKPLSGQRFTSRDEFAYCLGCFCDLYAKKCTGCANPISGECPGAPPLPLKVKKVNHCAWILWVSPAFLSCCWSPPDRFPLAHLIPGNALVCSQQVYFCFCVDSPPNRRLCVCNSRTGMGQVVSPGSAAVL